MAFSDVSFAYRVADIKYYYGGVSDSTVFAVGAFGYSRPRLPRSVRTASEVFLVFEARCRVEGLSDVWYVFFTRSLDSGITWEGPSRVSSGIASSAEMQADISISSDGTLFVVWSENLRQGYFVKSDDGGLTWSAPSALPRAGTYQYSCRITAHSDGQRLVVAYSEGPPSYPQAFVRSSDGGSSWQGPVNSGNTRYESPDLKFVGDILYGGACSGGHLWPSRSADFGASFSTSFEDPSDLYEGVGIYAETGKLWIAFHDGGFPTSRPVDCYYTLNDFGSWNLSAISGSTNTQWVSIDRWDGDLHCVWEDGGYSPIAIRRSVSADDGGSWSAATTIAEGIDPHVSEVFPYTLSLPAGSISTTPVCGVAAAVTYFFLA